MGTYTRRNAWDNGGTFDNEDLLWYAKGVGAMQRFALDDKNSWWFFAAIHGEYLEVSGYPGWGSIPAPPQVPTTPLPDRNVQDTYWNQCQHQSWYFLPWHRGYLIALEAQIRASVVAQGGPASWALPYWNYLGPGDEYRMPPAFAQETLPDGSPNPLYVLARYGPQGDGNIFIPIPPVSNAVMSNTLYTGSNAATPRPGFGGPETGFHHGGGLSGNLESNPHNQVHVDVGGEAPNGQIWGLMSDPGLAALDPIFYLHHCNIDRMWAVWNADGNANPNEDNWLNGPAAIGERPFIMPLPDNDSWTFTPADVDSLSLLNYTYDQGLTNEAAPRRFNRLTRRLKRLGALPVKAQVGDGARTDRSELCGAHDGAFEMRGAGARTTVRLDPGVKRKVLKSLAAASERTPPDHVYLQLENVRGTRDAHKLTVHVGNHEAGTVALFGLRRASMKDGPHGGGGLNFELDITHIFDTLYLDDELNVDSLDVRIMPNRAVPESAPISVGRVSVYRESQQ